jgi:NAD(P)-dependent dehydrogenase (short-subunit alcohol dehydrogenase family)
MLKHIAALAFYARFFRDFSRLGYARRVPQADRDRFRFDGQRWVITGATGGIGRAIALRAAAGGAKVIALARDPAKLDDLVVAGQGLPGTIEPCLVDLSLVSAVRAAAASIAAAGPIDVVVANVGVMLHDWRRTAEGIELGVATNLVNHYVLVEGLRRSGALGPKGLVVSMSSGGMYGAKLDLAALEAKSAAEHDGFVAYAQHKRAQVELTRYWNGLGPDAPVAQVMHPGWVDTDGVRTALPGFRRVLARHLRTAEQGADTALWLAATRPPAPERGGIWLDRHVDPEHAFGFTRGGATAAELAGWIERRIGEVDAHRLA